MPLFAFHCNTTHTCWSGIGATLPYFRFLFKDDDTACVGSFPVGCKSSINQVKKQKLKKTKREYFSQLELSALRSLWNDTHFNTSLFYSLQLQKDNKNRLVEHFSARNPSVTLMLFFFFTSIHLSKEQYYKISVQAEHGTIVYKGQYLTVQIGKK